VPDTVRELLATDVALDKLARRSISRPDAEQLLRNRHAIVANLRGDPARPQREDRRLVIGRTDGGRPLTLVIEATLEPTTWMLITAWESTAAERRILTSR
jgi:uncharacterized DUF497 family protein